MIKESNLHYSNIQLEQTARHFLFYGSYLKSIGLFNGKMGLMIFLFHYTRYSGNTLYEDFAMELFDEICMELSPSTPVGLADGLCGIGWGILYLCNNGFIEDTTNDILREIDEKIMEYDLSRMKDQSLETGFKGIALYLKKRIDIPGSLYDMKYRMNFEHKCSEIGWIIPSSTLKIICSGMLQQANPFPSTSTYCWQKELFKICKV